jgi:hypothetical protein
MKNVAHSLTSTLGNIKDLEQMMKVLLTTIVQSNAEVAAGQEASLVATADLADSRMNEINMLAENTATTLNGLKGAVVRPHLGLFRPFLTDYALEPAYTRNYCTERTAGCHRSGLLAFNLEKS